MPIPAPKATHKQSQKNFANFSVGSGFQSMIDPLPKNAAVAAAFLRSVPPVAGNTAGHDHTIRPSPTAQGTNSAKSSAPILQQTGFHHILPGSCKHQDPILDLRPLFPRQPLAAITVI
jgi:hypothetical protein